MSSIIKIEELSEELRPVANFMGLSKFLELCDAFGGSNIYLPTKKSILRNYRNGEIIRRYNGRNSKELAKEFCISEMYVKSIIRKSK